MNGQEKKSFFKNMRRDSGELRLVIVLLFVVVALCFLYAGYRLAQSGVSGEWKIVADFKGWTLYLTSISPGLGVIMLGAAMLSLGLPRVIKSL